MLIESGRSHIKYVVFAGGRRRRKAGSHTRIQYAITSSKSGFGSWTYKAYFYRHTCSRQQVTSILYRARVSMIRLDTKVSRRRAWNLDTKTVCLSSDWLLCHTFHLSRDAAGQRRHRHFKRAMAHTR